MPSYALGLILISLFSIEFKVFPSEAPQQSTVWGMLGHPVGIILPVITLTLVTYALFSRYMRSSAIDSLAQDYVRTARATGSSWRRVLGRHVLRNSPDRRPVPAPYQAVRPRSTARAARR